MHDRTRTQLVSGFIVYLIFLFAAIAVSLVTEASLVECMAAMILANTCIILSRMPRNA